MFSMSHARDSKAYHVSFNERVNETNNQKRYDLKFPKIYMCKDILRKNL